MSLHCKDKFKVITRGASTARLSALLPVKAPQQSFAKPVQPASLTSVAVSQAGRGAAATSFWSRSRS